MNEIQVGTAISRAAGRAKGTLKVADLPDGRPMQIPVLIVRGASDGPVLWLHGCVHGNEYCGTFIIHKLLRELDTAQLSGAIVALPVLNITAFQKSQRMSPYEGMGGGDLNRCFPGNPEGPLTSQMAHAIYTGLHKYATYLVDFHTAMTPDTRWALYANAPGAVGKKAEGIARAFGFKSTLPAPMDILAGSAMMSAAKDGIPSFIVEMGGKGPAFSDEALADGVERLRNVLRHLKMLPGDVTNYGPLTYFSNFAWIHATQGGLFQPAVDCGDRLEKGSVVGRYLNLHGDPEGEALSPHPGIVLAHHAGPLIGSGETLVHIGLDPREV
jgi:uncharacterized protein